MPKNKSTQRSPNYALTQSLRNLKKNPSPSLTKKYDKSHEYFPSPAKYATSSKPYYAKKGKNHKKK